MTDCHMTSCVLEFVVIARTEAAMPQMKLKLEVNGRVLLPAEVRRQLGVTAGDTLLAESDENGLRIWTADIALRRAQSLVSELVSKDRSLVDELFAERRAEAKRFDEKFGLTPKPKGRARK